MSRDAAEPQSVADVLLVAQVFMSHSRRSFEIDLRRAAAAAISRLVKAVHGARRDVRRSKEKFMTVTKLLGIAAVGAVLALAAPAERAQALSLINPGAATAVQQGTTQETTQAHWHGHRHWHPRRHYYPRHHWRPHRWHRHHGHW
jgi:hypothetical protein